MHQLLLTIAVCQTFFASFILILGKDEGRSRSAVLLGGFVFVYGVSFFQELDFVADLNANAPALVPLTFFFYFLIGPTFYFYIKDMTKKQGEPLVSRWPLHVAPILLGVALMSVWVLMPEDARQTAISNEFWPVERPVTVFIVSTFLAQVVSHVQIFCYLMGSLGRLSEHLSRIQDIFSNLENKTLGWLRLSIFALIAIWFTDLVTDIAYVLGLFGGTGEIVFTFAELMVFYFVTVRGFRQPAISVLSLAAETTETSGETGTSADQSGVRNADTKPQAKSHESRSTPRSKYAKSALDEEQMTRISEKLEQAMQNQKLFADSTLTLTDLSRSIHTPQNYVSQTLNQKMQLKFYDYISLHRVEAAKRLLADANNENTILEIALEVGFNSKSTFNSAFKRLVGATPSRFRQETRQTI